MNENEILIKEKEQNLYKNNLFKLQLKELLDSYKKHAKKAKIENTKDKIEFIEKAQKECKELKDAVELGNIWLQRRHLDSRDGYKFNKELLGYIMAWLFNTKVVRKQFTSYQIFKLTLNFLQKYDFNFVLNLSKNNSDLGVPAEFVSIMDPTDSFNLAESVSKSCIQELQFECGLTISMLEEDDRFSEIFLTDVRLEHKYDLFFKVDLPASKISQVHATLVKALAEKVNLVSVYCINDIMCIGIILNPAHALEQVIIGTHDDFVKLWGPRAQLRRFQDSTIKHAVVFDASDDEKHTIVPRMVQFILQRHFDVDAHSVLSDYLPFTRTFYHNSVSAGKAFTMLGKVLRGIDLPLVISVLHPASDTIVNANAVAVSAIPHNSNFILPKQWLSCFIEFEHSGKWPDDIMAIETMKRAFFIKIAEQLEESDDIEGIVRTDEFNASFIEIRYMDLYFKVGITVPRTLMLLKSMPDGLLPEQKELWNSLKLRTEKNEMISIIHYSRLALRVSQFRALAETCRLMKRLFSSQLIIPNIAPEIIELLCVHVFVSPAPFEVPQTAPAAFLRALQLIGNFEFNEEPLIIEMEEGKINNIVRLEIAKHFKESRIESGKSGIFISTEYDRTSTWFSQRNVDNKIVQRFQAVARATLAQLNKSSSGLLRDIAGIFIPSTHGFDFIIHLNSKMLPEAAMHIFAGEAESANNNLASRSSNLKNVESEKDKRLRSVGELRVLERYLDELRKRFDRIAFIFGDVNGGTKLYVKFKTVVDEFEKVSKFGAYLAMNVSVSNNTIVFNRDAVMAEMERIGSEFVVGVEVINQ